MDDQSISEDSQKYEETFCHPVIGPMGDPVPSDDLVKSHNPVTSDDPMTLDNPMTSDDPVPSVDLVTSDDPVTSDDTVTSNGPMTSNDPVTSVNPVDSDDLVTSDDPVTLDDLVTTDDLVPSVDPPGISLDPPDGGYGWVVVLCGWFSLLTMSGTYSMFGMIYPDLLHTFEAGDVYTVAVVTSTFFCMYIVSIFAGSLCDMFGCRVVALLGNAIAAVGLIMAAFATNFTVLFIAYGVMTGTGYGHMYMAHVVIIQQYFTKKRSIAFGIANSGIGMGMFVYAPITRHLLHVYGWRGTLLMLAALWLHGMIAASLLRPLPAPPPPLPLTDAKWKTQSSLSFYSSLPIMPGISSSPPSHLDQSRRSSSVREHADKYATSQRQPGTHYKIANVKEDNNQNSPSKIVKGHTICASKASVNSVGRHSNDAPHASISCIEPGHIRTFQVNKDSTGLQNIYKSNLSIMSKVRYLSVSKASVRSVKQQLRPCSVFTRLASTICNMLDPKAFANVYVLLFTIIMITSSTYSMIPVYLPRKCMEAGLSSAQVATLLSIGGLMDTSGRILFGILGYRFDYTTLHAICIAGTGVCMMSIAFSDNFWFLLACMAFGYSCFGGYANMCSATIVDFVGVEKFARVFGFVLCGASLGFILAGPVVAQIYTVSQSYSVVFVVCGCMQLMGALLCVIVLILRALNCGTIYQEEPVTKDV